MKRIRAISKLELTAHGSKTCLIQPYSLLFCLSQHRCFEEVNRYLGGFSFVVDLSSSGSTSLLGILLPLESRHSGIIGQLPLGMSNE